MIITEEPAIMRKNWKNPNCRQQTDITLNFGALILQQMSM